MGGELARTQLQAELKVDSRLFLDDAVGTAQSTCIRLPPRSIIEVCWPQYFYLPQPLFQELDGDLRAVSFGNMRFHAVSSGIRYLDYMQRAVVDDHQIAGGLGLAGSQCPVARPICGCPF